MPSKKTENIRPYEKRFHSAHPILNADKFKEIIEKQNEHKTGHREKAIKRSVMKTTKSITSNLCVSLKTIT